MKIGCIDGATNHLGAPAGWNAETNGPCGVLPVRAEPYGDTVAMTSAWFPSQEEIARLAAGAPLHLRIVGGGHPPVWIDVGQPDHQDGWPPLSPPAEAA